MEKHISINTLNTYQDCFVADRANIVAMNAVSANGLNTAARDWSARAQQRHQYSIQLDHRGVTNQRASGRCWMFAALNCLRYKMMHELDLEDFELSQSYTFFYDKLERANYFLESVLETIELPATDRVVAFLMDTPVQDGGQWDMIANIIKKYGVVPKDAMPDSACATNSREMNSLLEELLRGDACALREGYQNGKTMAVLRAEKNEMLAVIHRTLCICLGTPPQTIHFQARSKSGEFFSEGGLTPQAFYEKYINVDLNEYVSLINAPTADKPYYHSYTVSFLGNVMEGNIVRYVNVPSEVLKAVAIAQMKDGAPVWFGCDVGKRSTRDAGAMDLNAYDYEALLGTTFNMTKAQRLEYGHSRMTHAMVFQGVDLDEKEMPVRWRVENSWGKDAGNKGMYLMSDAWFDEYMYQVVVHRKYLPDDVLTAYDSAPITLAPWDPMGALAE